MVQDLGTGCLLGKSDVILAIRFLPVSIHDFDQLGFIFDGRFYFDKAMPFGCSIARRPWELFATFLEFNVASHSELGRLRQYLDDFLFGDRKGTNQCASIMGVFKQK